MARFRKVDTKIWNDEKFRGLSDDSKFAFFFVLTHPNLTALGAMRGTLPGLAAELNWPIKRFCAAIQPLRMQRMVEVSEEVAWVCLPKFLRYNEPEGPNSVKKAWVAALDLLPECPEKQELVQRCRTYLLAKSDDFRHAMGDAIWDAFGVGISDAKSYPSPIQEPEQEPEPEKNSPLPPKGVSSSQGSLSRKRFDEEFWPEYPPRNGRKVEKHATWLLFEKLSDHDQTQCLLAVKHYVEDLRRSGLNPKDPKRFLRDGKENEPWRDWIEPVQPIAPMISAPKPLSHTCVWLLDSNGRRSRACGEPIAPNQPHPIRPFCPQHLEERRRIDAKLQETTA